MSVFAVATNELETNVTYVAEINGGMPLKLTDMPKYLKQGFEELRKDFPYSRKYSRKLTDKDYICSVGFDRKGCATNDMRKSAIGISTEMLTHNIITAPKEGIWLSFKKDSLSKSQIIVRTKNDEYYYYSTYYEYFDTHAENNSFFLEIANKIKDLKPKIVYFLSFYYHQKYYDKAIKLRKMLGENVKLKCHFYGAVEYDEKNIKYYMPDNINAWYEDKKCYISNNSDYVKGLYFSVNLSTFRTRINLSGNCANKKMNLYFDGSWQLSTYNSDSLDNFPMHSNNFGKNPTRVIMRKKLRGGVPTTYFAGEYKVFCLNSDPGPYDFTTLIEGDEVNITIFSESKGTAALFNKSSGSNTSGIVKKLLGWATQGGFYDPEDYKVIVSALYASNHLEDVITQLNSLSFEINYIDLKYPNECYHYNKLHNGTSISTFHCAGKIIINPYKKLWISDESRQIAFYAKASLGNKKEVFFSYKPQSEYSFEMA